MRLLYCEIFSMTKEIDLLQQFRCVKPVLAGQLDNIPFSVYENPKSKLDGHGRKSYYIVYNNQLVVLDLNPSWSPISVWQIIHNHFCPGDYKEADMDCLPGMNFWE